MAGQNQSVRIGSFGAMWGDSRIAYPQLLRHGSVDFLVADYLAEFTMGLLARQKLAAGSSRGFCRDFVTREMRMFLKETLKRGVRVVVNAGGSNPEGCAAALLEMCKTELKMATDKLPKIATVSGDALGPKETEVGKFVDWHNGRKVPRFAAKEDLERASVKAQLKKTSIPPDSGDTAAEAVLLSANAYLGAEPIKVALDEGAQIVVTGRVVDSALVLGILMHKYPEWMKAENRLDLFSAGTLAGHLVECGCQGVGGLNTEWQNTDWDMPGYPIVEVDAEGRNV